jgi:hypothetical protein
VAGGAYRGHRLLPSTSCGRPARPEREVRVAVSVSRQVPAEPGGAGSLSPSPCPLTAAAAATWVNAGSKLIAEGTEQDANDQSESSQYRHPGNRRDRNRDEQRHRPWHMGPCQQDAADRVDDRPDNQDSHPGACVDFPVPHEPEHRGGDVPADILATKLRPQEGCHAAQPRCLRDLGPARKRSHLGGFENLPCLRLYRIVHHDSLQLTQLRWLDAFPAGRR